MELSICKGKLSLAAICCWVAFQSATIQATAQQPAPSLFTSIQTLEQTIGLPANPQFSALDRVSAIETRVYGAPQSGSLLIRLAKLRETVLGIRSPGSSMLPYENSQLVRPSFPAQQPPNNSGGRPEHAYPPLKAPERQAADDLSYSGDPLTFANASPPRFLRIDPPGSKQTTGDYYSNVLKATKGKTLRFKTMPIPVYITPFSDADFTNSVIRGFEAWEEQTSGLVRFVQIDSPEGARIRVAWKHLGAAPDDTGCTLGAHTITKWKTKAPGSLAMLSVGLVPVPLYIPKLGPKYSVPPQLIEVNLDLIERKNPEIRYLTLQNVVTHELGHALGILGHSPYKNDMMYPITDEHSRLSPRDIATISKIYNAKVDIPL
jgi:hypothetical protein